MNDQPREPFVEEIDSLERLVMIGQGSFNLFIAQADTPETRQEAIRRLEHKLKQQRVIPILLEFTAPVHDLLGTIRTALQNQPPAPSLCIMVSGLERSFPPGLSNSPLLSHLNQARDLFPKRVPHPLVLWLPDEAITDLARGAPDFWAWRHSVFTFPNITHPSARSDDWRSAYLQSVYDNTSWISLGGVDPQAASDIKASLKLASVYTGLLTLTPEEQTRDGLSVKEHEDESDRQPRGAPRRQSALEVLDRQARLVMLGEPGSGKSTFVDFVALCLAGEALGKAEANLALLTAPLPQDEGSSSGEEKIAPQPWSHGALLPIKVTLRDFAVGSLPPPGTPANVDHLWNFLTAKLAKLPGETCAELRRHFDEEGGLLLVDGLDEVPEADQRRGQIKQVVDDFAARFPRARILVTSRTYAYQEQDWKLAGFAETVLAPFSRGQINWFIEKWYAHVAQMRKFADPEGRAALLKRAIFSDYHLFALAERPLLLTLMASLHYWRGGDLPQRREELYEQSVYLLMEWWQNQKNIYNEQGQLQLIQPSLAEWLLVDKRQVLALLNELAYRAHAAQAGREGTADIPEKELLDGLLRLSQNPQVRRQRLIEYLSQRAGLLLPRAPGVYSFPHRTFQEYLAACYLTDEDFPEKLASLVCADFNRWREVALLAVAKASRGLARALWDLVDALCSDDPPPTAEGTEAPASVSLSVAEPASSYGDRSDIACRAVWGAHLAAEAIVETANLNVWSERTRRMRERVCNWLVYILNTGLLPARERARAGNNLALLGDLRFDPQAWHLPKEALLGLVRIPAGKFLMGSKPEEDDLADEDEQKQHEVSLPDYWIGRYPVTQAQFAAFVQAGGYQEARYWSEAEEAGYWRAAGEFKGRWDGEWRKAPVSYREPFNLSNHPVVGVSWYEALAYCRWLAEKLRQRASEVLESRPVLSAPEQEFWVGLAEGKLAVLLPSEAEWEKAARGSLLPGQKARIYPWGDGFDADKANIAETDIGATSTVGCFPGGASPYGVQDLSGNIWEWTRSLWGKYPYPGKSKPRARREYLAVESDVSRVLRGGAFYLSRRYAGCACRYGDNPDYRIDSGGFRVAVVPLLPLDSGDSERDLKVTNLTY